MYPLKKYHKRFVVLALVGFWFWLTETVAFLFIYGWHLRPIGNEVYFDAVASVLFILALYNFMMAVNEIIEGTIKAADETIKKLENENESEEM